jgi:hypothetical protein
MRNPNAGSTAFAGPTSARYSYPSRRSRSPIPALPSAALNDQVVPHDCASAFLDERIERVQRLRVGVVHPGAENAQPSKLPAVLVRNHVVGIVGPRALVEESAQRIARQPFGRDDR